MRMFPLRHGRTALAEGIGGCCSGTSGLYVLVAKPDNNVSTKYVYEHLDAQGDREAS